MRVDSVNLDLFVFMNKSFLFLTLSITQHLKPEKNQQPLTCADMSGFVLFALKCQVETLFSRIDIRFALQL